MAVWDCCTSSEILDVERVSTVIRKAIVALQHV